MLWDYLFKEFMRNCGNGKINPCIFAKCCPLRAVQRRGIRIFMNQGIIMILKGLHIICCGLPNKLIAPIDPSPFYQESLFFLYSRLL